MTIKDYISRFSKVVFGVFLIVLTLTTDPTQMAGSVLFALIGIPFVMAGLFNWMPIVWVVEKVRDFIKPLMTYMKFDIKSYS